MSGFRNPGGQPIPELQDFRVQDTTLTLFLKLGDAYFTRRVNLRVNGAGLDSYHPEGSGVIVRGHRVARTPVGTDSVLVHAVAVRPFLVKGDLSLMERLAAQVWPVMEAVQDPAPKPYILPAREDVQPVNEHLNAAD